MNICTQVSEITPESLNDDDGIIGGTFVHDNSELGIFSTNSDDCSRVSSPTPPTFSDISGMLLMCKKTCRMIYSGTAI